MSKSKKDFILDAPVGPTMGFLTSVLMMFFLAGTGYYVASIWALATAFWSFVAIQNGVTIERMKKDITCYEEDEV